MPKLKYRGGAFIFGIPARDLSAAEVVKYGGVEKLVSTNLYELEEKPKPRVKRKSSRVKMEE